MPTILLVEDDLSISAVYRMKLEFHNFTVLHANNGIEGLRVMKNTQPDLILLDLMMPIMGGEEFLRKLRKDTRYDTIPVIVLTNVSREEAPKTLWHYGISGYFVKANHTPSELVAIIENTLENSQ